MKKFFKDLKAGDNIWCVVKGNDSQIFATSLPVLATDTIDRISVTNDTVEIKLPTHVSEITGIPADQTSFVFADYYTYYTNQEDATAAYYNMLMLGISTLDKEIANLTNRRKEMKNLLTDIKIFKLKYKAGDKVRINSFEWFVNSKNHDEDCVDCVTEVFTRQMAKKFCGETMTISKIIQSGDNVYYQMKEDVTHYLFNDLMIECKVE